MTNPHRSSVCGREAPRAIRGTMPVVCAFVAVLAVGGSPAARCVSADDDVASRAVRLMRRAMDVVSDARARNAAGASAVAPRAGTDGLDASRAALIGAEFTPLMTTMGSLESKRLATDPRWADVIARQLAAHGISPGDTVLASFSGSFPGLNLAVMASCRAMGVRLVAVSSVTASTWGANEPGFTWPEIEAMVARAGVMPAVSVAISLGGTRDAARDLDDEGQGIARHVQHDVARALGATPVQPDTLDDAIAQRMRIYRAALSGARPAAYINVGGNHASLGGARATFRREEGWLATGVAVRADPRASVTEAWLAEGVPVMNLLDVKSLARAWGVQ